MELRDYQKAAVESVYAYLRQKTGNPCVVLPTGAGKTPVIAQICVDTVTAWNGRVLVLAHVKELLEQTYQTLQKLCPMIRVGLYSAGLNRRQTQESVIVAGIQSVYDKANELGEFNIVVIDEAHLIPQDGQGRYLSMIRDLIEINPQIRIIGLTATPYRLDSGDICGPGNILTEICYEQKIKSLIMRGFLSKIVSKAAVNEVYSEDWKIVRGEFDAKQTNDSFEDLPTVRAAVREIVELTRDRESVLIFCQSVLHAELVAEHLHGELATQILLAQSVLYKAAGSEWGETLTLEDERLSYIADWLQDQGHATQPLRWWIDNRNKPQEIRTIYGDTTADERASTIRAFRDKRIKYLVNVNVLTIGFDAPNVDCVVLLRATASPGLYYQMVGRGFRLSEGKQNCPILDFGTNIKRHGPVDSVKKPAPKKGNKGEDLGKVCPHCRCVMTLDQRICPECGEEMPATEQTAKHDKTADDSDPLNMETKEEWFDVMAVTYREHMKKGADENAPRTMRVTYQLSWSDWQSEWICIEHPPGGYARDKAEAWWRKRCYVPIPDLAFEAAMIGKLGMIAKPLRIKLRSKPGEKFREIADYELERIPTQKPLCKGCNSEQLLCIDQHGMIVCGICNTEYGRATAQEIDRYGVYEISGKAIEIPEPIVPTVEEQDVPAFVLPEIYTDDIPF